MKLTVHCLQFDIAWENKPANFRRVSAMLAEAPPAPGGLIVLPEMFATGFSKDLSKTVERTDGETTRYLQALAVSTRCAVMGGVILGDGSGLGQNASFTCGPDGEWLATYIKRRPFTLAGEAAVHRAGSDPVVFPFNGFRIAPLVCYDLRFPELARDAMALGADLLVYISSWPIKRVQDWITLLKARAIENQAWVIGVNRTGTDPEFTYPGRTLIVDPHGTVTADAADREQVLSATLDLSVASDWRHQFPALADAGLQA